MVGEWVRVWEREEGVSESRVCASVAVAKAVAVAVSAFMSNVGVIVWFPSAVRYHLYKEEFSNK